MPASTSIHDEQVMGSICSCRNVFSVYGVKLISNPETVRPVALKKKGIMCAEVERNGGGGGRGESSSPPSK